MAAASARCVVLIATFCRSPSLTISAFKWARTNPPPKLAGYHNPGWPGCCRPPNANESRMIQAADWVAVSKVHHVSIPSDVKAVLESIPLTRGSPTPAAKVTTLGRSSSARVAMPNLDRRNSGSSSPPNKIGSISKATGGVSSSAGKGRSGGSPKQAISSLSRASSGNVISSPSASSSLPLDPTLFQRKLTLNESPSEKRAGQAGDIIHSNHSSPSRRYLDLNDGSATHRRVSSASRPHLAAASPNAAASHNVPPEIKGSPEAPDKRRSAMAAPNTPTKSSHIISRSERSPPSSTPRAPPKKEAAVISSASSSSGSESFSDSTVTSDGGFTDYLSDESEAELQRQAEARAALLAQNHAEEMEFKAARQQLASVDLRPPKAWNPGKEPGSGGSGARLASAPHSAGHFGGGSSYVAPFAPNNVAYTASSRG
ncbi:hypothetical protein HGRIS_009734 [Hohenbuehelia grisea]|uniref:Uncharacterized protein n=1 Tax=Hohenbuehelia grisea TaxID=104357 RepID=A0ABR3J2G1_9AGAR